MDDFEKYLNKAFYFLKVRPRSEKELRDKLKLKKAPQDIIERIVSSFKEQKFLNDEEFAKWWIEQRLRFRPKAFRIIELELKAKGISKEILEELRTKNQELRPETDLESAKKIVEKKLPRYKGLDRQEIYKKLGAHLARQGFSWDTIKKVIDEGLAKRV